ncbi:MAG: hypothetical protein WA919_07310 [Coleofasciculaceae cyanobacterium]
MSFSNFNSFHQTSCQNLHTPEILPEPDTKALANQLLEELQLALTWQKKTIAEAAVEIQQLLKQIEEKKPAATEIEKKAFITAAIAPNRREKFLGALQAGWKELLKEFLEHSYLSSGIAVLEEWLEQE